MSGAERLVGSTPLLAIVRFHDGGDLLGAVDALVRGGIDLFEITSDTPGALEVVEQAARAGRTVGMGTVLTAEQVRACAAAGARFVVSPGLIREVVEAARDLGLEPVPGVFTATEILEAAAVGASVMKLFPACGGGPAYVRALRGPFPTISLVPTGGVRLDEIEAYLEAGATAVALGTELVGRSAPTSDEAIDAIERRAARAAEIIRRAAAAPTDGSRTGSREPLETGGVA